MTGYNAPMEPSRPDDEDISDDVTQDRPMGANTMMVRKEAVEKDEKVELAQIQSSERVTLITWAGKIAIATLAVFALCAALYFGTQGVGTTVEHGETTVTVGAGE